MVTVIDTSELRASGVASLRRQLRFHHERRKQVETGPELTADKRVAHLEYHARLVMRLLGQLIDLEGH
jgi:hypothetical protein